MAKIGICDCCKEPDRDLDDLKLCFVCGCVQSFASIVEDATDLEGDAAVELASDLVEELRSAILERVIDGEQAMDRFIADVSAGMVRSGTQ